MIPVVVMRREAYDQLPDGAVILFVAPRKRSVACPASGSFGIVNPAIGVYALRGFHVRDSGVQL